MITPVANLPARSSLRASHRGDFVVPRTNRKIGCRFTTCVESAANRLETPAVDNNLQASFKNLFISVSFFSGDTVLTV